MSALASWFMGTAAGRFLGKIGGFVALAVAAFAAYLYWRSAQREEGRREAKELQRQADRKVIDEADTIEDRVRAAGAEFARDSLRDYSAKR